MRPTSILTRIGARRPVGLACLVLVLSACAAAANSGGPPSAAPSDTATMAPSPSTAAAPSPWPVGGPLTDVELASITLDGLIAIPSDAPAPAVSAAAAEATVRARFPGARSTIEVRRIALAANGVVHVGWIVALTPATGAACSLHPGLRPRAIEGGIVDDQSGTMFWIMECG